MFKSVARTARISLIAIAAISVMGLCAGPMAAFADEAEDANNAIQDLTLDYLQNGGDSGKVVDQLADELKDQAVDTAIGLLDLGFPGAGSAAKSLLGLFSGGSAGDAQAQAIEVMKGQIKDLEDSVRAISDQVDQLTIKSAKQENNTRLIRLRNLMEDFGKLSRPLARVGAMSSGEKSDYLNDLLDQLDKFLPVPGAPDNMWKWTNIRVQANREFVRPRITTSEIPEVNLALEGYLRYLALLASARDAIGDALTQDHVSRYKKHATFLVGEPNVLEASNLSFSILGRKYPVSCGFSQRQTTPNTCTQAFYCSSSTASRNELVEEQGLCLVTSAELASRLDPLKEEVERAPNPLKDVILLAALRLGAGESKSNQGRFDASTTLERNDLFAVDLGGHLYRFWHTIAKKDTWAEGGKPQGVNCADPIAQASEECQPQISDQVDCTKPSAKFLEACQPGFKKLDPTVIKTQPETASLARYEFAHEVSAPVEVGRDWSRFTAIVPSQQRADGFVVYGIQADGALIWRRINGGSGQLSVQEGPKPVGTGWNTLTNVFSTGEGILYGVAANADLVWYRHENNFARTEAPKWQQRSVGRGWNGFTKIFSPGLGVIYTVLPDGTLEWRKHARYKDGAGLDQSGAWQGPTQIGTGWNGFTRIAAGPAGYIYAVNAAGDLLFYRHLGWEKGTPDWEQPVTIAKNWSGYKHIFTSVTQPETIDIIVK